MNPLTESSFIHHELGKIAATLIAMKEDQDEFRQETKTHRIEALTHLDDTLSRITRLETITAKSAESLDTEVIPMVNKVKVWEQRGIGFLAFAGMAGTGLGAVLTKYGLDLVGTVSAFFKS